MIVEVIRSAHSNNVLHKQHALSPNNKARFEQAARAKCQEILSGYSNLETGRKRLERMIRILPSLSDGQFKHEFMQLPNEFRRVLARTVWLNELMKKGHVSNAHYGKERIFQEPSILGKAASCTIDICGGSPLRQLLHSVDYRLVQQESKQDPDRPISRSSPNPSNHEEKIDLNSAEVPRPPADGYLYKTRGAFYKNGRTTFSVYAPNAQKVSLVLIKHGKKEKSLEMSKKEDGVWKAVTKEAPPGTTYLYRVVDCNSKEKLRIDPFSYSLKPAANSSKVRSVVVDHDAYQWNDAQWIHDRAKKNPLKRPLSIYEMQIKSWLKGKNGKMLSYRELAKPLITYCKKMGFTHVEFYGLMEHIHKTARGYQVTNFFAPYRMMGSVEDLKYLVDQMHQSGIGVILDWIPAHYHHRHFETMYNFDGTDHFGSQHSNWGTLEFDYSKEETRRLMAASAHYWFNELHLDGIRVDAVAHILGRRDKKNPHGVSFFQKLNQEIHRAYPGSLMIAEETNGFPKLTTSVKKGGVGFDLKWGIGWSFDTKRFFRKFHDQRLEVGHFNKFMSFLKNIKRGEKIILSHSHDDSEKVKNTLMHMVSHPSIDDRQKFSDLRTFFAFQILGPSRGHLIHMGDEVGQQQSWFKRLLKDQSAVEWELIEGMPLHQGLQKCIEDLERLYRTQPSLWKSGEQGFQMLAADRKKGVVAYERGENTDSSKKTPKLIVVHNFSSKGQENYDLTLSSGSKVKKLKQVFNSNADSYVGGQSKPQQSDFVPTHKNGAQTVQITVPPLSTIVLQEIE